MPLFSVYVHILYMFCFFSTCHLCLAHSFLLLAADASVKGSMLMIKTIRLCLSFSGQY